MTMIPSDFPIWTVFIFFTWLLNAQDLICDGTVKASTAVQNVVSRNINFSQVSVKLFTNENGKAGHLKDEVHCIQTGYFFLPLYEPGNFLLQVQGPDGWTFEPPNLQLFIDPNNKKCPEKKLQFFFTGFSLSGYVHGLKLPSCKQVGAGPPGIEILMEDEDGENRTTKTDNDGRFVFDNVFPGKFTLSASTNSFSVLSGNAREIEMDLENTILSEPFKVGGTTLEGSVMSKQGGLKDVTIEITTTEKEVLSCGADVCSTKTGEHGKFSFSDLACGVYQLSATYVVDGTTYQFAKNTLEAVVSHASTQDVTFTLDGMSSSGVVKDMYGNEIEGAEVYLNNLSVGKTDANGKYYIEVLKEDVTYTLRATYPKLNFQVHRNIRATSTLPVLQASEIEVCGLVDPKKPGVEKLGRMVRVEKDGEKITTGITGEDGRYCVMLGMGTYKLYPLVTSAEKRRGIALSPEHRMLEIGSKDHKDQIIDFFQAQVKVGGKVNCLEACGSGIKINLSRPEASLNIEQNVDAEGKFLFTDVTPGTYTLSLEYEQYCWKESSQNVEINFQDVLDLSFQQSGFIVSLTVSHLIEMGVYKDDKLKDTLYLEKGSHKKCMEDSGSYKFVPKGCYKFDKEEYVFETRNPEPISMRAIQFAVIGNIHVTPKNSPPEVIDITVDSAGGSSRGTVISAKFDSMLSDTDYLYQFSFWGAPSEHYTFQPKSDELLFYPKTHSVSVSGQVCPPKVEDFKARPGLIISGLVKENIEGATIVIKDSTGKFEETHLTNNRGEYAIGPLYDDLKYSVDASKSGYEISRDKTNEFVFTALKLGVVEVKVVDDYGNPLPEVIVTLTNADATFLKHLPTEENGIRKFEGLFPGHYYVRTTLKEYTFAQQRSTDVQVEEGEEVTFTFTASRIAYSVFGSVSTLSKMPVSNVVIEAIPVDKNAHHEETRSNADGKYRLRGLQPGHEYKIQVKSGNEQVYRATPSDFVIRVEPKDFMNHDFIVFAPSKYFSLGGFVDTESSEELDVQLCSTKNERKVLRTIKLKSDMRYFDFSYLPASRKGEKYIVKVAAPELTHQSAVSEPAYVALHGHEHVDLSFSTKSSITESISSSSYLPFFLWLTILFAIMNYNTVLPFVTKTIGSYCSSIIDSLAGETNEKSSESTSKRPSRPSRKKSASSDGGSVDSSEVDEKEERRRKKLKAKKKIKEKETQKLLRTLGKYSNQELTFS